MTQEQILERAKTLKIAVIGDLIEDEYIIGDVNRISPEAPVVILSKTVRKLNYGGAGNVFYNLFNLGVDAYLFTRGDAAHNTDMIFVHPGKTPKKTRVMSNNHHLLRIDEEDLNQPDVEYDDLMWKEDFETLLPSLDCLIFSDYHKGTISASISRTIISMCNDKGVPVFVDAKRDFDKYHHSLLIKCNQHEAKQIHKEPSLFRQELNTSYFVVTLGAQGIIVYHHNGGNGFNGKEVGVVDVCGAGDTIIAITALAFSAGLQMIPALELANKAAAESCKHAGVYALTKEDFLKL